MNPEPKLIKKYNFTCYLGDQIPDQNCNVKALAK